MADTSGAKMVDTAEPGLEAETRKEHNRAVDLIERVESLLYIAVGVLFLAAAIAVLGYSLYVFPKNVDEDGFPLAIIHLINELLLVVILLEMLRTVLGVLQTHHIISLRSFLIIGAISSTRRLLTVGAAMAIQEDMPAEEFNRMLLDLGVNAGIVIAIVLALYIMAATNRRTREDEF